MANNLLHQIVLIDCHVIEAIVFVQTFDDHGRNIGTGNQVERLLRLPGRQKDQTVNLALQEGLHPAEFPFRILVRNGHDHVKAMLFRCIFESFRESAEEGRRCICGTEPDRPGFFFAPEGLRRAVQLEPEVTGSFQNELPFFFAYKSGVVQNVRNSSNRDTGSFGHICNVNFLI